MIVDGSRKTGQPEIADDHYVKMECDVIAEAELGKDEKNGDNGKQRDDGHRAEQVSRLKEDVKFRIDRCNADQRYAANYDAKIKQERQSKTFLNWCADIGHCFRIHRNCVSVRRGRLLDRCL